MSNEETGTEIIELVGGNIWIRSSNRETLVIRNPQEPVTITHPHVPKGPPLSKIVGIRCFL